MCYADPVAAHIHFLWMCLILTMEGQTVCVCRSWLLYVEPGFKGSCVVLEEGERVLTSGGGELKGQNTDHQVSIGSIRRVVKVFSLQSMSILMNLLFHFLLSLCFSYSGLCLLYGYCFHLRFIVSVISVVFPACL